MASFRLRRPSKVARRQTSFAPSILPLEDRTVPTVFYVDPALAGSGSFTTVTFNKDYPGQTEGLIYGADLIDYNASPTTVNAFSELSIALQASELNPGEDTILIAHSSTAIPLNNTATQVVDGFAINSIPITQPLILSGSGAGATVITPTINTQADGLDDDTVSVFRVAGAGASLQISGLTFDGTGIKIGAGFLVRDGATATFDGVAIRNVAFEASDGVAIVGLSAGDLTVKNTEISNYGRTGILFLDTSGTVDGATIVASGAPGLINNGIEVLNNSTVTITGSTISGNTGSDGSADSAGVLVAGDPGTAPSATLLGNSIYGNVVGILIGEGPGDPSVVNATYNNIAGNEVGIDATGAATTVQAPSNFWGSPSGPFADSNPTGTGNPALGLVNFLPTLAAVTPAISADSVADYKAAIATLGVNVSLAAGTTTPIAHPAKSTDSVSFIVTFSQAVTGFASDDLTITGAAASSAIASVVGSGTTYTVTLTGLSGIGQAGISVKANAATGPLGFENAASNTASVEFTAAPDVTTTVALATGQTTPIDHPATATDSATFTVTFSESVTGFAADDLTIGGTAATAATATISGSGSTYTVVVTGLSGAGTVTLAVKAGGVTSDAGGTNTASGTATVTFNEVTPEPELVQILAVGPDTGGTPFVQLYNADGTAGTKFLAFEASFTGGVRVATGDIDGDGTEDIAVGAGVGGGPRVRVFSGKDQSVLADFFAYESTVRDGAFVAIADLDGDGKGEVIVGAGIGGAPAVAVFGYASDTATSLTERYRFFAFENTARGGVLVAGGDVDGDGKAEIIAGAGVGGAPAVAVFSGIDGKERYRFFAYSSTFRNGVFVGAGDLDGDGKAEIVAGAGAGGGPQIRIVRGSDGTDLGSFFAYDSGVRTGVRVAVSDVDGDGVGEAITGPGSGAVGNVRGFKPLTSSTPVFSVTPFDASFAGGVFVG